VLAVAGTSVLAFRKPDTIGDHSFQDIRMDCSKGKGSRRFGRMCAGVVGAPMISILSETAGARDEMLSFLQRLNRMACIDG